MEEGISHFKNLWNSDEEVSLNHLPHFEEQVFVEEISILPKSRVSRKLKVQFWPCQIIRVQVQMALDQVFIATLGILSRETWRETYNISSSMGIYPRTITKPLLFLFLNVKLLPNSLTLALLAFVTSAIKSSPKLWQKGLKESCLESSLVLSLHLLRADSFMTILFSFKKSSIL